MEDLKFTVIKTTRINTTDDLIAFEVSGERFKNVPIVALDESHVQTLIEIINAIYLTGVVDGMDKVIPKWKETIDAWGSGFSGFTGVGGLK